MNAVGYEQWGYLQILLVITQSFLYFITSPKWMLEVVGRSFRMIKAKIKYGNLEKFFDEEAERGLRSINEEIKK